MPDTAEFAVEQAEFESIEREAFFARAGELGVSADEARRIARTARERVGPSWPCEDPRWISWRLDCGCGREIRVPFRSRPTRPFRCPDCSAKHSPDALVFVSKDSPEQRERLRLLRERTAPPPRSGLLDPRLARLQDRLVGAGNPRWLLAAILGAVGAPFVLVAAILLLGMPPRPVEPAPFDRPEPAAAGAAPGPSTVTIPIGVDSVGALAAVSDCEVVVEIEGSDGRWHPAGMQRVEGSPLPQWGDSIQDEANAPARAPLVVDLPPETSGRRCRLSVSGRYVAPIALLRARSSYIGEGVYENRVGEFESTTTIEVGTREDRERAEAARRRYEDDRAAHDQARAEYHSAKKRAEASAGTSYAAGVLALLGGAAIFQAWASLRR